ncbi:MAG TPA: glycerate dehydrogenase, partial [Ruminococcus sp.]|nr:glycerate dehydrogenase [Ruminococcus sp.]
MKIVILDSETVSRGGDVSLDGITSLGDAQVYGYTPNEEVADKIGDADAVICNKCLMTEEVFEKCKNLKYVGLFATGYNNVDLNAADRHGAVVCNVPA